MENYNKLLEKQLNELNKLILVSNKNLMKLKEVPEKRIRLGKRNGYYQYYLVDENFPNGKYVKTSEIKSLKALAQKEYELKINKELYMLKRKLESFIKGYHVNDINDIYDKMSEGRKRLVTPIIETDEMFIENWLDDDYEPMPISDEIKFYSNNGTRVRSKSELIIVNMLEQYEVPYKYEKPITLKGVGKIRPDLHCLNVRGRKEMIWEHFGMMDNEMYANKNISKINLYQENGYITGKNMIMSFESSKNPLNSRDIKRIIEEYLL